MASTSQKIKKIDYALYHEPLLIPQVMRDCSIGKGLLASRLHRVIPRRVGIEFELIGQLGKHYLDANDKIPCKLQEKKLADKFGLFAYSEDYLSGDINNLNEIRVSINKATQLKGLYNVLEGMKRYCEIPDGGGIHIHIDFSKYAHGQLIQLSANYVSNHLDEVEAIFPKYIGKYNERIVGIHQKATWVNFSMHKSIEFRIAPLTFDYETLLNWIIKCNKFVSNLINKCHLDSRLGKLVKDTYVESAIIDRLSNSITIDESTGIVARINESNLNNIYITESNVTWMSYISSQLRDSSTYNSWV